MPRGADRVSVAGSVGVKCPQREPVGSIFLKIMSSPHLAQRRYSYERLCQDMAHSQPKNPGMTPVPSAARERAHEPSSITRNGIWQRNSAAACDTHRRTLEHQVRGAAPGTQNSNLQQSYAIGWLDKHRCYGKSKLEMVLPVGGGQDA